jgi:hypothetical protein
MAEQCAACTRPEPQNIDAPLCRPHFNRYVAWAMDPEVAEDELPYPACHIIESEGSNA